MTKTTENWPDLAGRLTRRGHLLPVRVYFEDTDFSGVVYHANFLKFMERGRSDMLRLRGLSHKALIDGEHREPLAFAVRHIDVTYLKPARIDEVIEVETTVAQSTAARLVLEQKIRRGSETLVEALVTVVMVNAAGRARRIPKRIGTKFVADDDL